MIKPHKLFPLPQDKFLNIGKPKSTPKRFERFKQKAMDAGVEF